MVGFNFKKVFIESYAFVPGVHELSSDSVEDRLSPIYDRLKIPYGTLEKLSGIKTRYFFGREDTPSKIATQAAKEALEKTKLSKSDISSCVNCSVTRDFFEPAVAVLVHNNLGLKEDCFVMDITNACVGFSNGIIQTAQMIEAGIIKAGIITSGENLVHIMENTFKKLLHDDKIGRKEFLKLLPTFTLGSGAVAMVLVHESLATTSHKLVGSVMRSASFNHELCVGNGDFCFCQMEDLDPIMSTDSQKLISEAGKLGHRAWKDLRENIQWDNDMVDHFICHQVGRQVNQAVYEVMGVPYEKEKIAYPKYGNLVSAALPSALMHHADSFKEGEKILLGGFGSGLNSIFSGLIW